MTPGAQIEAAIELLTDIAEGYGAADDIVGNWFRRHRFAGVKDRGGISAHIYHVLRHRAQLDWWIEKAGQGALARDARTRLIASLVLIDRQGLSEIAFLFDGDRFRPARLSNDEAHLIAALAPNTLDHPKMPPHVAGNYPEWLTPHLATALGEDMAAEMAALNGTAPLDLRANALKTNRNDARIALADERIKATPTPYSPLGLRVTERIPLSTLAVFKDGRIEVQDEGSQVAALLADARPGMRVVDFCAGAGGKTLALAAQMKNRGHLVACDISEKRLERSAVRLRRAGVSIVQRHALSSARDKWVKRHAQGFDRVFVDAPCTGTGTWRRNPDAKWRLKPTDLTELTALQADILDSAARLAKPGGRVVYVTCSLLAEENERQVENFLASHPTFSLKKIGEVWAETIGGHAPLEGDMLRLSPGKHGTDGFFCAVLERAPTAVADDGDEAPDESDEPTPSEHPAPEHPADDAA